MSSKSSGRQYHESAIFLWLKIFWGKAQQAKQDAIEAKNSGEKLKKEMKKCKKEMDQAYKEWRELRDKNYGNGTRGERKVNTLVLLTCFGKFQKSFFSHVFVNIFLVVCCKFLSFCLT